MRAICTFLTFAILATTQFACSDDVTVTGEDAGSDSGPLGTDAGPSDSGSADAGPATFLAPSEYAGEVVLAPAFPFGVRRRIVTKSAVASAGSAYHSVWGRHGGPLVTRTGTQGDTLLRDVIRVTLPTAGNQATEWSVPVALPYSDPASHFPGYGLFDLRSSELTLDSYTTSGPGFPGEALAFNAVFSRVVARAFVNGFYDGVAVPVAGESIVYAGLSGFAAAKSTTAANGLYIANVCAAGLIPQGACPTPRTLMTWAGSSGPVAADRAGNVFVAASFYGKDPSDVICTVSRAAVDSGAAAPSTCTTGIASTTGTGVEQVAAGLRAGAASGWALVKLAEYGGKTSAYAQKYNGATALGEGAKIADAITYGSNAESFSVINDDNGGLWITVNSATGGGGVLLELAERP